MFESVVPEAFQKRRKWLFYEVLPLSIGVHGIGIAAAMIGTVWNVVFPLQSPRLVRAYSLISIPEPPPPPPPPPPAATPKPPPPQQLPPPIDKVVAPTVIPDIIPQIPDPAPAAPPPPPTDTAPAGVPGDVDGQAGGLIGATGHGPPGAIPFPDDGRVHIDRSQQLPLQVVSQEFPHYPDDAKRLQLEDQVVVRYVIGKNGRILSVEILSHASYPAFDTATVDAIREWRFRPMIKDGKPVEVEHDLAVNYVLIRH
jgi:protein TonB